jgi:hypothetical protein
MKITLINNVLPENLFNTKKELLTRRLGAHIQIQCHNTSDTAREWVEVAPLLGMADCILDIIETGTTLKANGLEEWYPLYAVSSQLICKENKAVLLPKELDRILYDIAY